MAVALPPTAEDLLDWLGLTASNYSLQDAEDAVATAVEEQAARCIIDPYTSSLREAALRRGARVLAGRGAPQGVINLGPMGGPMPIVRWDALIEEMEADYRRGGFS